ncbi:hypothetical protein HPC62_11790 [Thermoleptolyngbya sichuanensis A183]|uniref:Uncharacterized protein n=1 Tax=Thermoleptolyngbya sichuanensis A183 TaxID=2737172 RepID=A0A6M8BK78_9CYAN|nr:MULTISPECIES: hypothetical protein [Thermoleptolyngbya]QKD82775.1 hypothetical protein HPC62_11790 [Thermoleptolyngbya sichuanensis A183]
MNAYKLAATLIEDGTLILKGLPFHAGDTVEIIILEQSKEQSASPPRQTEYPLQGKQPYRYDDPFEPAVPAEDWEVLK